ncbi:MAG: class I SAM-dependent methyltransferase [Bdellovibrionales bacterium]|nr:class I SAM-dependent methyltransferase [Bdellovibrionales bacterium]
MTSETGKIQTAYPQEVWDEEHTRDRFEMASADDQVRCWMDTAIEQWVKVPPGEVRSLEIGCFPGRYLAYFGARGYEVNGIDLTPRVAPEMLDWLVGAGYRIGRVEKGDFFAFTDPRGFDIVLSNGFLEHFPDWERCFEGHLDLVRPGGLLLLATPNFVGKTQRFLHEVLDRENFDRHCLEAMNLEGWRRLAESRGFEVLRADYFAEFDFWNGPQRRPLWQKAIGRGIQALIPILRLFIPSNSSSASPYLGIVARRKE